MTKTENNGMSETQLQQQAIDCANALWKNDVVAKSLGMVITAVAPGAATIKMSISDNMLNGHGMGHGGYIFTLADTAFAYACNSYNQNTVAQHCSISFIAPVYVQDELTASAIVVSQSGRSGIYDIKVSNQHGITVGEFRGHSRTVKGTLLPIEANSAPAQE